MPDADQFKAYLADRDVPCPGCGYNLRGAQEPFCPECGIDTELHAVHKLERQKLREYEREAIGLALLGFTAVTAMLMGLSQVRMTVNLATLNFPASSPPGSGDAISNFPIYEIAEPFGATSAVVASVMFVWLCVKQRKRYTASPGMWFVLNPLTVLFGGMLAFNVPFLVVVAKLSGYAVLP